MKLREILRSIDRQAWLRFFVALLGLLFAFAAAIFSTVMRESGNMLGVAVSASVALLTAGMVGLYTVPYLAKRVAIERVREAFDYDVTREGLVYLAVALAIIVAAINTGNNLLFIIVAAMLAAVVVSGMASAIALRGLTLDVMLPARVFAKQAVAARIELRNRFPVATFSVSVGAKRAPVKKRYKWEKTTFAWPPKAAREQQWIRWPDWQWRKQSEPPQKDLIFEGSIYFPYIRGGSAAHADLALEFPRRGVYLQKTFSLSTRFPFSFLVKTRHVASDQELLVYPTVERTEELEHLLPLISGEFESFVRGRGYDLYRIRDYTPGDPARHVDWKATARSGSLKIREFTREDELKVRVIFDNPSAGAVSGEVYERAVAMAASLAWHFSEAAAQLRFASGGETELSDVYDILGALAVISPREAEAQDDLLRRSAASAGFNLVLTSRPRGSLPTQLWANSYVLFMQELGESARSARRI